MAKNAIVTINMNNFLDQNTRDSFEFTANRWNCSYIEIVDAKEYNILHPAFVKLKVLELCDADRIFLVDADAIIRADAPNIFEITHPELFYAVQNDWEYFKTVGYNPKEDYGIARVEIDKILKVHPVPTMDWDLISRYFFNAGVQVYSRKHHSRVIDYANLLFQDTNGLQWWDQMPTNLAVYSLLGTYQQLDLTWNWRFPRNFNKMEGYVIHFAGDPGRYEKIKHVNWRNI